MNQDMFLKVVEISFLVVGSLVLWRRSRSSVQKPEVDSWLLLPALLVFALVVGTMNLNNAEGDPDTSTWLTSLITIRQSPDKLKTFLNYTDSRPLTVLPLYLVSCLGFAMNYGSAQVVGLVCWLLTTVLFYRTVLLFSTSGMSLLYCWLLVLFQGTTGYSNFVSYNSEHISVLMITGATYLYLREEKYEQTSTLGILGLGLLLGSLLFAKFQNVPMGLVIAAMALVSLLRRKHWAKATALVTGGVLPTLLVNLYYASYDALDVFWNSYFWNYFYYSYSNEFSDLPMLARFLPYRIGAFVFWGQAQGLYLIPLLFCLAVGLGHLLWHRPKLDSFQAVNGTLATLLVLSSAYAVLQSGNHFEHYILYMLVPLAYLFAWIVSHTARTLWPYLLGIVLLGAVAQGVSNLLTRTEIAEPVRFEAYRPELMRLIRENSRPTDRIVVWGWSDWLYVRAERAAGYRIPHTHHLFMRDSELYPFREKIFLQDMKTNQPQLFLDAANPELSTQPEMQVPFDEYPRIKHYIGAHYHLIGRAQDVRVYARN